MSVFMFGKVKKKEKNISYFCTKINNDTYERKLFLLRVL